jgi:Na+/H+ antiporter NhaC
LTPLRLSTALAALGGVVLTVGLLVPDPDPGRLVVQGLSAILVHDHERTAQPGYRGPTLFGKIDGLTGEGQPHRLSLTVVPIEGSEALDLRAVLRALEPSLNLHNTRRRERGLEPLSIAPPGKPGALPIQMTLWRRGDRLSLSAAVGSTPSVSSPPWRIPGRGALLPPLLAIAIALALRRTVSALFVGIWVGAIVGTMGSGRSFIDSILPGLLDVFGVYLVREIVDSFRIEIIGFVVALVAMIGVITRSGGVQGMIDRLSEYARTVRSTLSVTFGMGILIFFDDYANCLLVGNTMRPLTDRLRVSREKLAYIVDSTAAPIAGISLLSTWIAFEVSTYASQLPAVGITENPYAIFVYTIPFRFYCIFSLAFVALNILTGRDFGPMRSAERRARTTGAVIRTGGQPLVSEKLTRLVRNEAVPADWRNGAIPVAVTLGITLLEIFRSGGGLGLLLGEPSDLLRLEPVSRVLFEGSGARPLFVGASAGLVVAGLLALRARLPVREIGASAFSSARSLGFAIVILFEAWMIGRVCQDLNTAEYLIALLSGSVLPSLFPVLLLGLSALIAFATGSSWSTMAILLPNVVGLAASMGSDHPLGSLGMVVVSIGAVLEGSIFGDHCSPISDTTILSSVASASDHVDHVRTQMPYAVTVAVVAAGLGYIPTLFFGWWSFPIAFVLGVLALALTLRLVGRTTEAPA